MAINKRVVRSVYWLAWPSVAAAVSMFVIFLFVPNAAMLSVAVWLFAFGVSALARLRYL